MPVPAAQCSLAQLVCWTHASRLAGAAAADCDDAYSRKKFAKLHVRGSIESLASCFPDLLVCIHFWTTV